MIEAGDQTLVVGLGEALWDCFQESRSPGGAPANVAFHAGQFGHHGVVVSRVGEDPLGDELIASLAERHLDTSHIQRDPIHPTGTVTVDTTRADRPIYTIHENAAWDFMNFDRDCAELMSRASAVCFGTLAQRSEPSRRMICQCLAESRGALLVYDVNLRQSWYRREWIEQSMRAARIVKLNLDEVETLNDLLEIGKVDTGLFCHAIRRRFDVESVFVTRAEDGCVVVCDDERVDIPGVHVRVADSVGAGDAFTAGLISGTLWGWPSRAIASLANETGAMVAARKSAMPPIRDELTALRRRIARQHGIDSG